MAPQHQENFCRYKSVNRSAKEPLIHQNLNNNAGGCGNSRVLINSKVKKNSTSKWNDSTTVSSVITASINNTNNYKNPPAVYSCIRTIKCVIIGDKNVGKTALAVSYSNDTFPTEYAPTAYDNYNVEVHVDDKPIRLELCDTTGEDELNPLRSLCYPGADVFLLCFSVTKPWTFYAAGTRWPDELKKFKSAAILLIGTQADSRTNPAILRDLIGRGQRPVSYADAINLADKLNATYVETSAKSGYNLKKAFDLAIIIALERQAQRKFWWQKHFCCL